MNHKRIQDRISRPLRRWGFALAMALIAIGTLPGRAEEPPRAASPAALSSSPPPSPPSLGKDAPYPWNADIGGVPSPFTRVALDVQRSWPLPGLSTVIDPADEPVRLRIWTKDPRSELYMGVEQSLRIQAPLETVEKVLDDLDHFKDIFPGFKDVHIVSRDRNRLDSYWEERVPFFFIPNVKYHTLYLMDKSQPNRRFYRYQLKPPAGTMKASDGLIVIERIPGKPSETFYFELDFFDVDWGPARVLGTERLWKETVEGLYESDLGARFRAEHPDWSFQKIRDESERVVHEKNVRSRIEARIRERKPYFSDTAPQ